MRFSANLRKSGRPVISPQCHGIIASRYYSVWNNKRQISFICGGRKARNVLQHFQKSQKNVQDGKCLYGALPFNIILPCLMLGSSFHVIYVSEVYIVSTFG